MNYAQLKVPEGIWDSCKSHAKVLGMSATAFANKILQDALTEMSKDAPGVPAVIQMYRIAAQQQPSPEPEKKQPGK